MSVLPETRRRRFDFDASAPSLLPPRSPAPVRVATPQRDLRRIPARSSCWGLIPFDALLAWAATGYAFSYAGASSSWGTGTNLVVAVLWVTLLSLNHAYDTCAVAFGLENVRRLVRSGTALATALLALTLVTRSQEPSSGLVLTAALATAGSLATHAVGRTWARHSGKSSARVRVVVAGHRRDVTRVVAELRSSGDHSFEVVATCLPAGAKGAVSDLPLVPGFHRLPDAIGAHEADAVIVIPCRHFDPLSVRRLGWRLERTETQLFLASGLGDVRSARATVGHAGTLPLLHVRHADLHGARRWLKDVWERAAALIAVIVLAPALVAVGCAIRIDSSGPAIFRQVRMGKDGRRFTMLKFRTMTTREEHREDLPSAIHVDSVLYKSRTDPRVTPLGRHLRTYSLDELPQLFNVVLGQMSLVGPRPALIDEVERYEPDTHRRLAVKPGITGLWQVSGRSDLSWESTVRLDLRYVDNWSIGLDLLILVRTVQAVLGHRGAY